MPNPFSAILDPILHGRNVVTGGGLIGQENRGTSVGADPWDTAYRARALDNTSALNRIVGPWRYPFTDLFGGGRPVARQMRSVVAQVVSKQQIVPIGITGNGAMLTGQVSLLPLLELNQQAPGN